MEDEYKKIRGELKKRAAEAHPIGFFAPDTLEPSRARKHGSDES
jgi:transitional endoplasmic reticulum ATPase